MRSYKKLNEREFHRMISEATMRVVQRVLQEAGNAEEYYKELPDVMCTQDATGWDYDWLDQVEAMRKEKGGGALTQADFDELDRRLAQRDPGERNKARNDWTWKNMPQTQLSYLKNQYDQYGYEDDLDYYNRMNAQYGGMADRYSPNDYNIGDYAQY